MIRFYRNNGCASIGVDIPSFFLCLLILLCFSLPVKGALSSPAETVYNSQNPFPEKYFLNVDDGQITLITRNNPLGPILEEISRRSGVTIKVSPTFFSKKITVTLKNISLDEGIKKIAEDSELILGKFEEGGFYFTELNSVVPESAEQPDIIPEKLYSTDTSSNIKTKLEGISPINSFSSGVTVSQDRNSQKNIVLNEIIIRFKQDISEKDIHQFLADSNIKVKKYIAALKYHILSLPEGMSYYDAMALFKRKNMLYQAKQDYLVPVK